MHNQNSWKQQFCIKQATFVFLHDLCCVHPSLVQNLDPLFSYSQNTHKNDLSRCNTAFFRDDHTLWNWKMWSMGLILGAPPSFLPELLASRLLSRRSTDACPAPWRPSGLLPAWRARLGQDPSTSGSGFPRF